MNRELYCSVSKWTPIPGNDELLRIRDPDGNVVQLHPI
jgi:hypothetical protein